MTHYYIKSCYIRNRTAFIVSILGCLNREITKLPIGDGTVLKRRHFSEALSSLSYALMEIVKTAENPGLVYDSYDYLEVTDIGSCFSKVQEAADAMVECLEDDIKIHFTGLFGEITTEFMSWLPNFNGKIVIVID